MAPLFFTLERLPAVSRIIAMPAPVPPALVRSVAGRLYRTLAFADPARSTGPWSTGSRAFTSSGR